MGGGGWSGAIQQLTTSVPAWAAVGGAAAAGARVAVPATLAAVAAPLAAAHLPLALLLAGASWTATPPTRHVRNLLPTPPPPGTPVCVQHVACNCALDVNAQQMEKVLSRDSGSHCIAHPALVIATRCSLLACMRPRVKSTHEPD